MKLLLGNSRYGIEIHVFWRTIVIHIEWKGKTYGGSWGL